MSVMLHIACPVAYNDIQVGFLENLVKVFPSLATRPFYLTGESYAGRYIVSAVECVVFLQSSLT